MNKKEKQVREDFRDSVLGPARNWGGMYDADNEIIGNFSLNAPLELITQLNRSRSKKRIYEIARKYAINPNTEEFKKYSPNKR